MKGWWRSVRGRLLPGLVFFVARLIGATLRIKVVGLDRTLSLPSGKILAGWHGRTFVAANYFRGRGVWTIISQSRDGEAQNRIFRRFGFNTIRGSSGRSGVRAAIEAIRVLREGATMAFTPDGPRGPSGVVQGGMLLMAQKAGAAMVPCGVSASRRWLLGTWDRYMVPKPFARAIMIFGEPFHVPADAGPEEIERIRQSFETAMHRLELEAERAMGHGPPGG